ncbi:MAG: hypothetical protein KF824_11875 [Fimbriimonadaceae bacterium]|nr:MAG: hypothetical protein KF824_11875 [Fimbriimonadaceae bacterium]
MNELFGQVVKAMVVLAKAIAVSVAAKEAPVQKPAVTTSPKPSMSKSFDWRNLDHLPKQTKEQRTFVNSEGRVFVLEFVKSPTESNLN